MELPPEISDGLYIGVFCFLVVLRWGFLLSGLEICSVPPRKGVGQWLARPVAALLWCRKTGMPLEEVGRAPRALEGYNVD